MSGQSGWNLVKTAAGEFPLFEFGCAQPENE